MVKTNPNSLILSLFFGLIKADQPVHCLRENVVGDWKFHVSKDNQMVNLFEINDICTHKLPNGLQLISQSHNFSFENQDIVNLSLNDDLSVSAFYCESGTACDKPDPQKSTLIKGKWTTVYDQALKIELENGLRFISNLRYNAKDTLTKDPLDDAMLSFVNLNTGDYGSFDSDCSKTMVGFVQSIPSVTGERYSMTEHKAVCFYGGKNEKTQNLSETESSVDNSSSEPRIVSAEAAAQIEKDKTASSS